MPEVIEQNITKSLDVEIIPRITGEKTFSALYNVSILDYLLERLDPVEEPNAWPQSSARSGTYLSNKFLVYLHQSDNEKDLASDDQLTKLNAAFSKELERIGTSFQYKEDVAEKIFLDMKEFLVNLPFDSCAIEITSENDMKIILSFSKNRLLMLTRSLVINDLLKEDELFYSYFIDRKLIASDVKKIHGFSESFQEYISTCVV